MFVDFRVNLTESGFYASCTTEIHNSLRTVCHFFEKSMAAGGDRARDDSGCDSEWRCKGADPFCVGMRELCDCRVDENEPLTASTSLEPAKKTEATEEPAALRTCV